MNELQRCLATRTLTVTIVIRHCVSGVMFSPVIVGPLTKRVCERENPLEHAANAVYDVYFDSSIIPK